MKSMSIINRIVRDSSTTDETCLKNTFKTRQQLLDHLKIPSGRVPRGYEMTTFDQEETTSLTKTLQK